MSQELSRLGYLDTAPTNLLPDVNKVLGQLTLESIKVDIFICEFNACSCLKLTMGVLKLHL